MVNKIKALFSPANAPRADRRKSAPAEFLGGQPVVEEVTAERIEKLYSIWDYAPKLDP